VIENDFSGISFYYDSDLLNAITLIEHEQQGFKVDWETQPYIVKEIALFLRREMIIKEQEHIKKMRK